MQMGTSAKASHVMYLRLRTTSPVTTGTLMPEERMTSGYRHIIPNFCSFWDGHCNVQYVTNEGLAAYITKYVTKGEPLSMLVNNGDESTASQRHVEWGLWR